MNKQMNLTNFFFPWLGCAMLFLMAACQNESSQRTNGSGDTVLGGGVDSVADTTKTLVLPYEVVFNDENASFEVRPNPQNSSIALDKDELAEALNIKYPEIGIELDTSRGDTLFVKILDAAYLTQSLGTSGARTYLAEATYAFTELPDIHVVHFDFKEGDHAMPGYYKRSNFKTPKDRSDAF